MKMIWRHLGLYCFVGSAALLLLCQPVFAGQPLAPVGKIKIKKIQPAKFSVKIANVSFSTTRRRGIVFRWRATIMNAGTAVIRKKSLTVKATQLNPYNGAACDAGTGRLPSDILPGKSVRVTGSFNYGMTHKLQLDVLATGSSLPGPPIATRVFAGPQFTADFKAFTFVRNKKQWTAIVRNTSMFPLQFNFSVAGETPDNRTYGLALTNTKLLAPNATQTFSGTFREFVPGSKLSGKIMFMAKDCASGNDAQILVHVFSYTY